MQQLFKIIVMIAVLVNFQGAYAAKFSNEPELKSAAYDVFMKYMIDRKASHINAPYINCVDLDNFYRHADSLGIAHQDIAGLARRTAIELYDKLKNSKREWTEEEVNALVNAIRIRNLVLYCSNRR